MSEATPDSRQRPADAPCLNCGNTTPGNYCPECGQRKTWVRVSVRAMIADVLEDQLVLNRTLPRTLAALLFKPGRLTEEYVRGRIVSYIAPFRLYLVSSVLFFLILSFIGLAALERVDVSATGISANPDSARATLLERQQELSAIDTTEMNAFARVPIRRQLENTAAALALISDTATALDSATLAMVRQLATRRGVGVDSLGRQPWAQGISIEAGSSWIERAMKRKLNEVSHLPGREAARALAGDLLEYAPHMVFLLLPVFALLLKLLYIRRDRYYAEHFVFALHVHAFTFIMMTVLLLVPWDIELFVLPWIALYVWIAMKRVYAQGWVKTSLKWWTLGWLYSFVLTFGLVALALVALVLT